MKLNLELFDINQEDLKDERLILEQAYRIRTHIGLAITTQDLLQHSDEQSQKKYDFLPQLESYLRIYALELNFLRYGKLSPKETTQIMQSLKKHYKEIVTLLKRIKKLEGV